MSSSSRPESNNVTQTEEFKATLATAEHGKGEAKAAAQNKLGNMLFKDKKHEAAVKWYLKAAKGNNTDGQYNLAMMYMNGHGVVQNDKEARKWLKKAAEKHKVAQRILAEMYEAGRGCKKNLMKAFKQYTKAAEQGDITAQCSLAEMYWTGWESRDDTGPKVEEFWSNWTSRDNASSKKKTIIVAENKAKSVEWYTKAAEQGDITAQRKLAEIYGNSWISRDDTGSKKRTIIIAPDQTKSIEWYKVAAEHGDQSSQIALGKIYLHQDNDEAIKWLRLAVAKGNTDAKLILANLLISCKKETKDEKEAFQLTLEAAQQGDTNAQLKLADMYANGVGTPQDKETAFKHYHKVSTILSRYDDDHNGRLAAYHLGLAYKNGLGTSHNPAEARKSFKNAIGLSFWQTTSEIAAFANYELGLMDLEAKNYASAFSYLYAARRCGYITAAHRQNVELRLNEISASQIPYESITTDMTEWWHAQADKGNKNAARNFAIFHEKRGDIEIAIRLYTKAADAGDEFAQITLAKMYRAGTVVPKDESLAIKYYRMTAAQGNAEAQFEVFLLDLNKNSSKQEFDWLIAYVKANPNHAEAHLELAQRYEEGRGVSQDDAKAIEHYRIAAEHDNAVAQYKLALRYEQGNGITKSKLDASAWQKRAEKNIINQLKQRPNASIEMLSCAVALLPDNKDISSLFDHAMPQIEASFITFLTKHTAEKIQSIYLSLPGKIRENINLHCNIYLELNRLVTHFAVNKDEATEERKINAQNNELAIQNPLKFAEILGTKSQEESITMLKSISSEAIDPFLKLHKDYSFVASVLTPAPLHQYHPPSAPTPYSDGITLARPPVDTPMPTSETLRHRPPAFVPDTPRIDEKNTAEILASSDATALTPPKSPVLSKDEHKAPEEKKEKLESIDASTLASKSVSFFNKVASRASETPLSPTLSIPIAETALISATSITFSQSEARELMQTLDRLVDVTQEFEPNLAMEIIYKLIDVTYKIHDLERICGYFEDYFVSIAREAKERADLPFLLSLTVQHFNILNNFNI